MCRTTRAPSNPCTGWARASRDTCSVSSHQCYHTHHSRCNKYRWRLCKPSEAQLFAGGSGGLPTAPGAHTCIPALVHLGAWLIEHFVDSTLSAHDMQAICRDSVLRQSCHSCGSHMVNTCCVGSCSCATDSGAYRRAMLSAIGYSHEASRHGAVDVVQDCTLRLR